MDTAGIQQIGYPYRKTISKYLSICSFTSCKAALQWRPTSKYSHYLGAAFHEFCSIAVCQKKRQSEIDVKGEGKGESLGKGGKANVVEWMRMRQQRRRRLWRWQRLSNAVAIFPRMHGKQRSVATITKQPGTPSRYPVKEKERKQRRGKRISK